MRELRRRRIARRTLSSPRSVEAYIRGAILPRFIERLREIEDELAVHELNLEHAYRELARSCEGDAERFREGWLAIAHGWNFAYVNELIRQHNEYYPIERNLPLDPRTGDYVTILGRPYRREELDAEWVLARFPASLMPAMVAVT